MSLGMPTCGTNENKTQDTKRGQQKKGKKHTASFPAQFCPTTICHWNRVLFGFVCFCFQKKNEPFGLGLKTDKSNHFYNSVWFHKVLCICFFKQHKPKRTALPSRRATPYIFSIQEEEKRRSNTLALKTMPANGNHLHKDHCKWKRKKKKKKATNPIFRPYPFAGFTEKKKGKS